MARRREVGGEESDEPYPGSILRILPGELLLWCCVVCVSACMNICVYLVVVRVCVCASGRLPPRIVRPILRLLEPLPLVLLPPLPLLPKGITSHFLQDFRVIKYWPW